MRLSNFAIFLRLEDLKHILESVIFDGTSFTEYVFTRES